VGGVLEDVARGHGGVAEAVDEEGFEFAFDEVEGDGYAGEGLQGRGRGVGAGVYVGAEEVEEWVDEEGAEVFDDEDGAPCDLRAWKFSIHAWLALTGSTSYLNLSPVSCYRSPARHCLL